MTSRGDPEPLPAASVIVLRDAPLEVLLLRRSAGSSFVPNTWVFPGGVTEEGDRKLAAEIDASLLTTMRLTAVRETFEETGVWLGAPLERPEEMRRQLLSGSIAFEELCGAAPIDFDQLVWTSRWITPVGLPKRFDTWFFLASVAQDVIATAEQIEATAVTWIRPDDALAQSAGGTLPMVFPTLRNLEALAGFSSVEDLLASRRGLAIEPILPRLVDGKPTLDERR